MRTLFLFLLLSMFKCFGQDVAEINKNLDLPDTLEFEKEVRIYIDYTITDRIDVFRMYDSGKNDWIVYIYHYNKSFKDATKIDAIEFPKEKIGSLKPKDSNMIWLNLLLTNVEYLPSLKEIEYKLSINYIEKEYGEYGISKNKIAPLDGEMYQVFIRNGEIKNHFEFDNPDSYLKYYPNVDELISYKQLVSVIKKEFNL